jgi:hypothetical protein
MGKPYTSLPLNELKQEAELALDEYIREDVLKINELGFKTLWCCSGLVEEHPKMEKIVQEEKNLFFGDEEARMERFWRTGYLCFEPNEKLPLVPGWQRENEALIAGPAIIYSIDENFVQSDDLMVNDRRVKVLWSRLFDFLNEALKG